VIAVGGDHAAAAADAELVEVARFGTAAVVAGGEVTGFLHHVDLQPTPRVQSSYGNYNTMRFSFND
jgi:hypothetical protein